MKNNLTINIRADDQLRSSNNNSQRIKIESNSIQILYPQLFDSKNLPTVPVCHQQEIPNENIDKKIKANLE
ncbi:unnamed protein product [Adineta steineri]|uniref:Uncharacterized protein n=1 Tax=Adineta steineri TaxID=433720 RepID=A0A815M578_9BILA|nr:unnamed protein product [Adineta steineri]CAF3953966.1 unnamed protein product [Adineta steineri]